MVFNDFDDKFILKETFLFEEYDFLFYDTHVCYYNLEDITSKVSSFNQLRYYAEVFLYLNPDIDFKIFFGIFQTIGNRDWGKSIRTYGKARIEQMCQEVFYERTKPFCNKKRKVIFNPDKIISQEEKLAICGLLFKRHLSVSEDDIRSAIQEIKLANIVISDQKIASILSCSQRTVQRRITKDIRTEISKSNRDIKRKIKIDKIIEYIDILSEGGNDVKIRELKKFISVKDYSMIKEAFAKYKDSL